MPLQITGTSSLARVKLWRMAAVLVAVLSGCAQEPPPRIEAAIREAGEPSRAPQQTATPAVGSPLPQTAYQLVPAAPPAS